MKTKRISVPSQVDLDGLPGARLRALFIAVFPPDAAEAFDAQLADLHAEWLDARARSSRARAAWLALCIRVHLMTGAGYYATIALGVRALRAMLMVSLAGAITLGLFWGLATLVSAKPEKWIDGHKMPPWDLRKPVAPMITQPDGERRPPPRRPPPSGPGAGIRVPTPGPEGTEIRTAGVQEWGPYAPPDPEPLPSLGRNFLCLPLVRSEPEYPSGALRRRIEGQVTVEVSIDRTGSVRDAEVLDAQPAGVFDDAVLRAVRRWRYRVPAGADDDTGCERAQVMLRFELPR
jgi:periplasmic protein TonB